MSYECVILFRNPRTGAVGYIRPENEYGSMAFPDREAAIKVSMEHPLLQKWPHQVVELDEL